MCREAIGPCRGQEIQCHLAGCVIVCADSTLPLRRLQIAPSCPARIRPRLPHFSVAAFIPSDRGPPSLVPCFCAK